MLRFNGNRVVGRRGGRHLLDGVGGSRRRIFRAVNLQLLAGRVDGLRHSKAHAHGFAVSGLHFFAIIRENDIKRCRLRQRLRIRQGLLDGIAHRGDILLRGNGRDGKRRSLRERADGRNDIHGNAVVFAAARNLRRIHCRGNRSRLRGR